MPRKPLSKRLVAKMQRVYQQTRSLQITAKACGVCTYTVAKYRDKCKWATPQDIKEANLATGNDITLTPDIAARLAIGWRVHIEDDKLCHIVGITQGQLHGWLVKNTPVTVVFNVEGPDGKERKRIETIGLKTLREREWAGVGYSYLQRILGNVKKMEVGKDFRGANFDLRWLLSKIDPEQFGEKTAGVNVNVGVQSNIVNVADLDLPLEMREKLLDAIRARKQVENENQV